MRRDNTNTYEMFLKDKRILVNSIGVDVDLRDVHPALFDFQKQIVVWACRKGRCAVFADTGLGKTRMQLEWARLMGQNTLILAPLSVARQTVREGHKIDVDVRYVRDQSQVTSDHNLWITNYEMLDHFDPSKFGAVVIDESSILKALDGTTRRKLTDMFTDTRYKLACTATPAPNDRSEIGNHSEFLGITKMTDMLAMFFVHANKETFTEVGGVKLRRKLGNSNGQEWRLKHHAEEKFYRWMASWAMSIRRPSDLGYDDGGFELPPLHVNPVWIDYDYRPDDQLVFTGLNGLSGQRAVRRETIKERVDACIQTIQRTWQQQQASPAQPNTDANMIEGGTLQSETNCLRNSEKETLPERPNRKNNASNTTGSGIEKTENTRDQDKPKSEHPCHQNSRNNGDNRDINTTSIIESESYQKSGDTTSETPCPDAIAASNKSMASIMPNMNAYSTNKTDNVPSVESTPRMSGTDSVLTTTTPQGKSEDYSATTAISESDTSQMTPSDWVQQLNISKGSLDKVVIWCQLNSEQDAIAEALGDLCISVYGSLSPEEKVRREELWREGDVPVIVSKASVLGWGMNWQHCHNQIFFGLSYSWEEWYQAIRRCYRFGQEHPVNIYVVLTDAEREVFDTIMSKETVAKDMSEQLIQHVKGYEMDELVASDESAFDYQETTIKGNNWTAMQGDSCQRLGELADNSIDLSVYSPPFADLYTYSNSEMDLGNSRNYDEFFNHYAFIIRQLLRVTKPGRLTCVHTSDIPAMMGKDGYIGVKDFPGDVTRAYEANGWIYHGYAVVAKNPQAQAIRTHSKALLFVQLRKDSSDSRPAILDRVLFFKKPGDNAVPVRPVDNGDMNNETWIDWAGGIWTGIAESDTLQYQSGRDADDEKHICPLQLGTIERCIKLYSNPGETVLTPFMGIGSEVYEAVKWGRKGIGIELKPSYYQLAIRNLRSLEAKIDAPTLFEMAAI